VLAADERAGAEVRPLGRLREVAETGDPRLLLDFDFADDPVDDLLWLSAV
jgi:hypothetical protein